MKKIIPALILLSLVCKSCKKDAAPPAPVSEGLGTISVSIDGSTRSFNYYDQNNNSTAKAVLGTTYNNLYTLTVFGQKRPFFWEDDLSITIVSPNPIVAGTYTNAAVPNTSLEIWYCPFTIPLQACHVSGSSGLVTISEISSSSVKGTFSATLSYVDNSGASRTNTLTNGKFNTPF